MKSSCEVPTIVNRSQLTTFWGNRDLLEVEKQCRGEANIPDLHRAVLRWRNVKYGNCDSYCSFYDESGKICCVQCHALAETSQLSYSMLLDRYNRLSMGQICWNYCSPSWSSCLAPGCRGCKASITRSRIRGWPKGHTSFASS